MSVTTYEALLTWQEMIQSVASKWGEMMDNDWLDLPPDTAEAILDASEAFADAHDSIVSHLEPTDELDFDFDGRS